MARKIATVSLVLAFSITAHASSLDFVVTDADGGTVTSPNNVSFPAGDGGTFSYEVWIDPSPGQYFIGFSLFMYDPDCHGFGVVDRTILGVAPNYSVIDPTTSDNVLFSSKNSQGLDGTLTPFTADLGTTSNYPFVGDPAGMIMTLDMAVPSDLPLGDYTVSTIGSMFVHSDMSNGVFDSIDDIVVSIVPTATPEPGTIALFAILGLALIRRR